MADLKISQLTGATTPLAGTEVLPIVQSGSTKKVSVDNLTLGKFVRAGSFQSDGPIKATSTTFGSSDITAETTAASGTGYSRFIVKTADREWRFINDASTSGSPLLIYDATAAAVRMTFNSAGNITFDTGNLIQGTAGKGVNFTANTGAAGKTSQLLNWYEEGTWTPTDNSGAGLTFSNSYGSYTRVGRMVFAQVIVIYPTTANTNSSRISGLPFTVVDSNGVFSPSRSGASVTFSDAGISMYGLLSQGTTEFYLFNQATAANVTNATLSGKAVRLMFAYPV